MRSLRAALAISLAMAEFGCRSRPVGGASRAGETVAIATKDEGVARLALLGDSGETIEGQTAVARALAATCASRGCDLVALLGDMLGEDGPSAADDPVFEEKLEKPYGALGVPVLLVLGNHDYGGGGAGWDDEVAGYVEAWVAKHPRFVMPTRDYRALAGPLELVALDTNASMYGDDARQRADVATWLAEATARTKVVVGHHPYRSNGDHGDAGRYDHVPSYLPVAPGASFARFFEDVVCDRAPLYVAGHDHSRQWLTEPCGRTELAISGAASIATHLRPRHPARFGDRELGFLYLEVSFRDIRASMIDEAGRVDFERTIPR